MPLQPHHTCIQHRADKASIAELAAAPAAIGIHRHARTAAEPLVGAAGRRLGDAATVSAQATPTGRHTEQARGEQGKLAPGTGSALTGAAPAARAGPS